jgi:hypothetical protein
MPTYGLSYLGLEKIQKYIMAIKRFLPLLFLGNLYILHRFLVVVWRKKWWKSLQILLRFLRNFHLRRNLRWNDWRKEEKNIWRDFQKNKSTHQQSVSQTQHKTFCLKPTVFCPSFVVKTFEHSWQNSAKNNYQ